jgi:hypothetical protein
MKRLLALCAHDGAGRRRAEWCPISIYGILSNRDTKYHVGAPKRETRKQCKKLAVSRDRTSDRTIAPGGQLKLNFSRTLSQLSYAGSSLMMIAAFEYDPKARAPPPATPKPRRVLVCDPRDVKWTNKGEGKESVDGDGMQT